MKKGIVITTSEYTKDWLKECLDSLPGEYPILIVSNNYPEDRISDVIKGDARSYILQVNDWNGFELGGIQGGSKIFDEFVHLMDTCVVKDKSMFDMMFAHDGSMCLTPGFFSYLGKFKTDILNKTGIPIVTKKDEAVYHERWWTEGYLRNDPNAKVFDPLLPVESAVFEEKHGRKNMVLDNGFIIKYKAKWC